MKLTKEQFKKLAAFKTREDAQAYLSSENLELTPETLDRVSGGHYRNLTVCPKCREPKGPFEYHCDKCGWQMTCPWCGEEIDDAYCPYCGWVEPVWGG